MTCNRAAFFIILTQLSSFASLLSLDNRPVLQSEWPYFEQIKPFIKQNDSAKILLENLPKNTNCRFVFEYMVWFGKQPGITIPETFNEASDEIKQDIIDGLAGYQFWSSAQKLGAGLNSAVQFLTQKKLPLFWGPKNESQSVMSAMIKHVKNFCPYPKQMSNVLESHVASYHFAQYHFHIMALTTQDQNYHTHLAYSNKNSPYHVLLDFPASNHFDTNYTTATYENYKENIQKYINWLMPILIRYDIPYEYEPLRNKVMAVQKQWNLNLQDTLNELDQHNYETTILCNSAVNQLLFKIVRLDDNLVEHIQQYFAVSHVKNYQTAFTDITNHPIITSALKQEVDTPRAQDAQALSNLIDICRNLYDL